MATGAHGPPLLAQEGQGEARWWNARFCAVEGEPPEVQLFDDRVEEARAVAAQVRVWVVGAGTILRETLAAAALLESEFGIPADVFSVTSFSELRRDALACERTAMLAPEQKAKVPWVRECLAGRDGPFIAATDYMKIVADQIRQWVPGRYVALGTDGFGRSDSRQALREHFEVSRNWIVVAALKALADDGRLDKATVALAIKKFGLDPAKPDPLVS
jgi:pyruvate dehydrogenase E1 component